MKNTIACGFIEERNGQCRPFPAIPPARFVAIGICGVEIFWHDGLTVENVRSIIEPHGLRVISLHVPCSLEDDKVFDVYKQFAERAVALDCARLYASTRVSEMPFAEACNKLLRIGDILARYGLVLGMETHPPFCHNAKAMIKTIETVGHPGIRLNFDTGNIYFYNEHIDAVNELQKVAKYVSSVHLKESTGGYHDGAFRVLGKGVVDFPGVFKTLADIGFDGPYTIELEGEALVKQMDTEDNIAATIKACVDYLRGKNLV